MIITVITDLPAEIHAWHTRNYPSETNSQLSLCLAEEFGELCRAELKQAGKIRGTWEEWQQEKYKEIGDVLISVIELANRYGCLPADFGKAQAHAFELNLTEHVRILREQFEDKEATDNELIIRHIAYMVGQISISTPNNPLMEAYVSGILFNIGAFCRLNNFDTFSALVDRWQTIRARDFIKNPLTGGREAEA